MICKRLFSHCDECRITLPQLDGKDFTVPTDRLIRAHEAAKILGVGQSTIGQFVKTGLLTPLYVNSDQRRFWLSEVMKLPRKKPWRIGGDRHEKTLAVG